MRQARMKTEGAPAVYYCVTRVVAGKRLLDADCKLFLQKMLWRVADFSGVEMLAYCIMSDQFHVLVRVPGPEEVNREELLRRYDVLYSEGRTPNQPDTSALAAILERGDAEAVAFWNDKLQRRMHDVSEFMKTIKQRFSIWYNRNHVRYGTVWADRFRSSLLDANDPVSLNTVAAYIDLNPVRSGIVEDPADYRWSSYGEATGGSKRAYSALAELLDEKR